MTRRYAPATLRNREPILEVLARVFPKSARVLEIASGTGEHATFLAERLLVDTWQPTDPNPESRESIDAWRAHLHTARVLPARDLDVEKKPWGPWDANAFDAILNVNMIHISPWSACEALFSGAPEVLVPHGLLVLYGPFKRGGAHTAPSNEAFDLRLRGENAAWGVRDLEDVIGLAGHAGFTLQEAAVMPANNLTVVFKRRAPTS